MSATAGSGNAEKIAPLEEATTKTSSTNASLPTPHPSFASGGTGISLPTTRLNRRRASALNAVIASARTGHAGREGYLAAPSPARGGAASNLRSASEGEGGSFFF